jgi:hypothetical protein
MSDRTNHEIETLTIRIPMRLQRRGGRKLIMTPEGAAMPTPKPRPDETLIKALVRAHRWRRRIESGQANSITDLAEQEGVTDAYVCRLLPLTCLAPNIVEAILDGRQPKSLRLAEVLGNGPLGWEEQRKCLGFLRGGSITRGPSSSASSSGSPSPLSSCSSAPASSVSGRSSSRSSTAGDQRPAREIAASDVAVLQQVVQDRARLAAEGER